MNSDRVEKSYITVRLERSVYDALTRCRLDFANDIEHGIVYEPDPQGSFPSLSWVIGILANQEQSLRGRNPDPQIAQRRSDRRRKGKVSNGE